MGDPAYKVVFRGEYSLDCDILDVKQKVAALLKLDEAKVEALFSGKTVTLKKGVNHDEAVRLKAFFDRTGGIAYVESLEDVAAPFMARPAPSPPAHPQPGTPVKPAVPDGTGTINCPKCGFGQAEAPSCTRCGVIFRKLTPTNAASSADEVVFRAASATPAHVMDESEERKWAMFCHLSALSGFLIPSANVIAPLLVWNYRKKASDFVDVHGKAAFNFQLTITLFLFFSLLISLLNDTVLMIFLPVIAFLAIYNMIIIVTSGKKANKGENIEIRMSLGFIK
ncbi:MAG TPA: DUF4870 domain-containing protein [Geobacteraceae bacterium]|nr:DUF4870 domain-containing protein [Geobacteraceae bacterium]